MSAILDHPGPWTAEDVATLPEGEGGSRFETIDGVLLVTPAPSYEHQRVGARLLVALQQAANEAGMTVEVVEAVNLPLPGGSLTIPDLVVVDASTLGPAPVRLTTDNVLAVVEIESPSSRRVDRVLKSTVYADAGIPVYWRVELARGAGSPDRDPEASVTVSVLDGGGYREAAWAMAGSKTALVHPVPIDLDPADLVRRR